MTRAAVAVVITCRDGGRALLDTLRTVHAQTLQPLELLILDDASEDLYTRQVLAGLPDEDTRVQYLLADQSRAALWNSAIESSTAPLIAFLDAGVLLAPRYLETMAAALNEQPAASFISCKTVAGDQDGNSHFTIASVLAGAPLPAAPIFRRTAWT